MDKTLRSPCSPSGVEAFPSSPSSLTKREGTPSTLAVPSVPKKGRDKYAITARRIAEDFLRRCYEGEITAQQRMNYSCGIEARGVATVASNLTDYLHPQFISDAALRHLGMMPLEIKTFRKRKSPIMIFGRVVRTSITLTVPLGHRVVPLSQSSPNAPENLPRPPPSAPPIKSILQDHA